MGFFDFLKGSNINDGVKEFESTPGAILLDVRTEQEYRQGHIPGSKNIPLAGISRAPSQIPDKSTPVFVYCLSGARSSQAAGALRSMGYSSIKNIGGISSWSGKTVV